MEQHKPGALKQQNKTHKFGRHRSKGDIDRQQKGKVDVKTISKKSKGNLTRADNKNRLNQIRKQKRQEIINKKRCIGTLKGVPHIVSIIPLAKDANCSELLDTFLKADPKATFARSNTGLYHMNCAGFKAKFNFLLPNAGSLNSILDAVKISDTVIFAVSIEDGIDEMGYAIYEAIYSCHLPASLFVVQGLKNNAKKNIIKKNLQKIIEQRAPSANLYCVDNQYDGANVLHRISEHKLNELPYCSIRPYMLVDTVDFVPDNGHNGTLKLSGYLRSRNLNVNHLVHIPTLGTFMINEIDVTQNPFLNEDQANNQWQRIGVNEKANSESQLQLEKPLVVKEDDFDVEDEIPKIDEPALIKKRVPKGTSDYQAAWILDESDGEGDEYEDDDEDDEDGEEEEDGDEEEEEDDEEEEEEELMSNDGTTKNDDPETKDYDAMIDYDEEQATLEQLKKAQNIDMENPDEVEATDSARVRFQRYRGLKSFRTSPWDRNENLPEEYASIFKFGNYKHSFKRVVQEESDGAEPGWYIMITIKNVPNFEMKPNHPLVVYGLLRHENKTSVVNLTLKRVNQAVYNEPIKSKEELLFYVGARRFTAAPIFSQHTNGNKFKFERYMPDDCTFVASILGPIVYYPASVLVFKKLENNTKVLIAIGSVLSIDPDRIVVKRVVLSGHPMRVQKRSAVVRYMFFNADDVKWFKPIELHTKTGKRGHIKEELGTHGHMKCHFNDVIKAQEKIMMNLYKRIYPKWSYTDASNDFLSINDDCSSNKME